MRATPHFHRPHSPELRRRLRERARRVSSVRRRIAALTVALLLACWGAVAVAGPLGKHRATSLTVRSASVAGQALPATSGSGSSASGSAPVTTTVS